MFKSASLALLAAVVAAGVVYASQPDNKVTLQVHKVPASNGKLMYGNYCAPCHGASAKGDGPVASSLKVPPTDLTVLSKNNNGKYPGSHIASILESGPPIAAHGSAEMPIWGSVFAKMDTSNTMDRELRISNLSRYLESIQAK